MGTGNNNNDITFFDSGPNKTKYMLATVNSTINSDKDTNKYPPTERLITTETIEVYIGVGDRAEFVTHIFDAKKAENQRLNRKLSSY